MLHLVVSQRSGSILTDVRIIQFGLIRSIQYTHTGCFEISLPSIASPATTIMYNPGTGTAAETGALVLVGNVASYIAANPEAMVVVSSQRSSYNSHVLGLKN